MTNPIPIAQPPWNQQRSAANTIGRPWWPPPARIWRRHPIIVPDRCRSTRPARSTRRPASSRTSSTLPRTMRPPRPTEPEARQMPRISAGSRWTERTASTSSTLEVSLGGKIAIRSNYVHKKNGAGGEEHIAFRSGMFRFWEIFIRFASLVELRVRNADNDDPDDNREEQLLRELKLLHRNQTIITGCSSDYSPDQEENPFDFGDAEMCVIGVADAASHAGDWALPWRHPAVAARRPTTLALSGAILVVGRKIKKQTKIARGFRWTRYVVCRSMLLRLCVFGWVENVWICILFFVLFFFLRAECGPFLFVMNTSLLSFFFTDERTC